MIFFISLLLFAKCYARSGKYECGMYGRFEYCIDNFPGCVIGCHCFPGYYFDTDTKICEPNTKMTKDYRRQLAPDGYSYNNDMPAQHAPTSAAISAPAPGPSAGDAQDGDLSDWLYNQFFKTIESQVINKTDDDTSIKETRRSGGSLEPVLARRSKNKKRKKPLKRAKERDYRKKLLRISEDDSMFDSSSDSESSESSSDESKSSSGSLGSWERYEWAPPGPGGGGGGGSGGADKPPGAEAGSHRQIVVYSKKPKPPLPSFIFLPNMQAPFYPPLGLPAPPIVPMYPMVPVPPINPCQTDFTESVKSSPSESASGTTTAAVTAATAAPAEPQTTKPPPDDKIALKKTLRNNDGFEFRANDRKKPPQVYKPPPHPSSKDFPLRQYPDSDSDVMFMADSNWYGEDMKTEKADEDPKFKYISQLIHRDSNKTTTQPPWKQLNSIKTPKLSDKKPSFGSKKKNPIKPGRLDDMTRRRFHSRESETDDSYYSTLGRQIATLIRGVQSKNRDADNKIEAAGDLKHSQPFFSEGSFTANTYWERFVRSPLNLGLNHFSEYDDIKDSNELLFDLENKVQEATTAPVLSWLELENIVNTMGTMRNKMHRRTLKGIYNQPSNGSLNISLLPKLDEKKGHVPHLPLVPHVNIKNRTRQLTNVDIRVNHFTLPKSRQKYVDRFMFNKTKNVKVKQSNDTNNKGTAHRFNSQDGALHAPKQILRRLIESMAPKPKSSRPLAKRPKYYEVGQITVNNHRKYYFDINDGDPHVMSVAGGANMMHPKKYFFDSNTNDQNWLS